MKSNHHQDSFGTIFWIFLRLGLTSFGGPAAHIGYFREAFVVRRSWLSETDYANLVALCQFLPGPASSQVGFAIGLKRGDYAGALAAWLGFTLPSAIVLMGFALSMTQGYLGNALSGGVLHGLKIVAVAVVAQAVWGMANQLCQGVPKITLAIVSACTVLLMPVLWGQLLVIVAGGVVGWLFFAGDSQPSEQTLQGKPIATQSLLPSNRLKILVIFLLLLFILPLLANLTNSPVLVLFDGFYRAGSLVFGGGHVVLPLLQAEVVADGLVSEEAFLTGYGLAQAVPGPLFTFAAFLGTASADSVGLGVWFGLVALIAVFLPSFLLLLAVLPIWATMAQHNAFKAALSGINAAVVGLLLAALYQPIWLTAVTAPKDFVVVLLALTALQVWKMPSWLVVLACVIFGGVFLS